VEVGLNKLDKLKSILKPMKKVLIAYSGGVDSTFLLKVAIDTLGKDNVLAVTACSQTYTSSEYKDAKKQAKVLGVKYITIYTDELKDKKFSSNPDNRCYFCKKHLFGSLTKLAGGRKYRHVLDASNADDTKDYRPGSKAAAELDVKSPLKEAGLKKTDIRSFSKRLKLDTWDKPATACLASRIPYGNAIKQDTLIAIEKAEDYLMKLRFRHVRVRVHGKIARIEVLKKDIKRLNNVALRGKIVRKLKSLGFLYITLDLQGYRTGSMNEVLAV